MNRTRLARAEKAARPRREDFAVWHCDADGRYTLRDYHGGSGEPVGEAEYQAWKAQHAHTVVLLMVECSDWRETPATL